MASPKPANEPGKHGTGTALPPAQECPTGHASPKDAELAPAEQYVPDEIRREQGRHSEADGEALTMLYVPSGQFEQETLPIGAQEPGAHGVGAAEEPRHT